MRRQTIEVIVCISLMFGGLCGDDRTGTRAIVPLVGRWFLLCCYA